MFFNEEVQTKLKEIFQTLKTPVEIVTFSKKENCPSCDDNQKLMEELAGLSGKISVKNCDFDSDKEQTDKYGVDKVPCSAILGEKDYGMRLYGLPSGYDFSALIEAIKLASSEETQLTQQEKEYLSTLNKDIHVQVFVSSGCPYCPAAALTAYEMAKTNDKIKTDVIDSSQFSDLAAKYNVSGVPHTVINDTIHQVGAVPASELIAKIKTQLK